MATNTYVALDKVTLSSTSSSVTFSSIPSTYTDLVLVSSVATTVANKDLALQFNGDTGSTNYSRTVLYGDGTSAGSARATSQAQMFIDYYGWTTTTLGTQTNIAHIMNYANTTTYKTVLARSNTSSSGVDAVVGLWRKTPEAITSITIIATTGGVFSSGSTFSLYGIKAEPALTTKATGGTIVQAADGYIYHTFTSSGTFTPSQALSCDYLVVAGGGGGGNYNGGGGGGAGGYRSGTGFAVTATGYSITVGGGGAGSNNSSRGSSGVDSVFSTITSTGGGTGGDENRGTSGTSGGSGGGAGGGGGSPGSSSPATSPVQGFAGGNSTTNGSTQRTGGGGGGAGAVGSDATGATGGNGGIGSLTLSSWGLATTTGQNVSGTVYYAGGGGGGQYNSAGAVKGTGGNGGGGNGGTGNTPAAAATNGTANTGGGGGGGGWDSTGSNTGGTGGSGIVIIRYAG